MKKTLLFSLTAGLLALAGCQSYEGYDLQAGQKLVSLEGTVEATPDGATRSIYDDIEAEYARFNGLGSGPDYFWPGWMAGDKIGAFDYSGNNYSLKYDDAKERFVGAINEGAYLTYTYYPCSEGSFAPTAVPVTVGDVQNFVEDDSCYYHYYDIYAGEPRCVGTDEGIEAYNVPMYRPTSLVKVGIDFTDIDSIAAGEITKIRYEAETPLSGAFTMDITRKYPVLTPVAGQVENAINVNFPEPQSLAQPIEAWLVVAPTIEMGDSLTLTITTDKHRLTIRTAALAAFQAGNRLTLLSIFDKKTLDRAGNSVQIETVEQDMLTIAASSGVVTSE